MRRALDTAARPGALVLGSILNRSAYDQRVKMMQSGPSCRSITAAKLAYKARQISEEAFEDTAWVLKQWRERELATAKVALSQQQLTRPEYDAHIAEVERTYAGN